MIENTLGEWSEFIKALYHPIRLKLVMVLWNDEHSSGDLHRVVGISKPEVSRHIGILLSAGIVRMRKHGQFHYYSLTDKYKQMSEYLGKFKLEE